MALEDLTGTKYIDDLNSSNPAAGDNVSEGDDHIRGIKNVLKTTFPSIDGAITATDTELNYVDGVTSAIQTQLDSPVAKGDGSSADGYIQLNCSQNSHGIKLQSPPHSAGASYTLVFPNDDGATNQKLTTNGSGVLTWTDDNATDATKLPLSGGAMTGAITTNSTFDGVDIATRDAVLTSTTTTANAALPKAGGTMTGDLILGDNVKVEVGSLSGGDLEIYHDGSHTRMQNNTGNLNIRTGVLSVTNVADNETILSGTANGSVDLYHNNAKKFETYASGVSATGNVLSTTGIFGLDANDNVEVGTSDINFNINGNNEMRLEADGDLHVDGDVIAFSTTISDEALKYDINPVDFALDKINQLRGVSYKYKHNDRESAGLLAQDVEKVMPSAVKTRKVPLVTGDDKEYKTLHYDSMTAILVEAIKELTAKVKKLENR